MDLIIGAIIAMVLIDEYERWRWVHRSGCRPDGRTPRHDHCRPDFIDRLVKWQWR